MFEPPKNGFPEFNNYTEKNKKIKIYNDVSLIQSFNLDDLLFDPLSIRTYGFKQHCREDLFVRVGEIKLLRINSNYRGLKTHLRHKTGPKNYFGMRTLCPCFGTVSRYEGHSVLFHIPALLYSCTVCLNLDWEKSVRLRELMFMSLCYLVYIYWIEWDYRTMCHRKPVLCLGQDVSSLHLRSDKIKERRIWMKVFNELEKHWRTRARKPQETDEKEEWNLNRKKT